MSKIKEDVEEALKVVLATLFGGVFHVYLAQAKRDEHGWYIDCVWQPIGLTTPKTSRISEGSIPDDLKYIPRSTFRQIARELANQRIVEPFRTELAKELGF